MKALALKPIELTLTYEEQIANARADVQAAVQEALRNQGGGEDLKEALDNAFWGKGFELRGEGEYSRDAFSVHVERFGRQIAVALLGKSEERLFGDTFRLGRW